VAAADERAPQRRQHDPHPARLAGLSLVDAV